MELNVKDRIVLLNILPAEGKLTTIRILRVLRDELSFSEEEQEQLTMREDEGRIYWDGDLVKDIEIGPRALAIILDEFNARDQSNTFKDEFLDTYAKFEEKAE